jgi:hypothetical protein
MLLNMHQPVIAGKVVSGYHIRRDSSGIDHWILLGKRNPLTPQMFYPIENQEPIVRGDKVVRDICNTLSCIICLNNNY